MGFRFVIKSFRFQVSGWANLKPETWNLEFSKIQYKPTATGKTAHRKPAYGPGLKKLPVILKSPWCEG